jgi:hypothetical protein
MVRYLIFLSFFIFSCSNSDSVVKQSYNFDQVFFDVVEKKIIYEGEIPDYLKSITKNWFDNDVKLDGIDGTMEMKLLNYKENISNISDGKKIELFMNFEVFIQKNNNSTKQSIKGDVSTYSTITGSFALEEIDTLISNSQVELIRLLIEKLNSNY